MFDGKDPLRRVLSAVPGTVRLADETDALGLHELATATFALACPPSTTADSIATFIARNLGEEHFRAHLGDPTRLILVADGDARGELAGYTMTVFDDPADPDVVGAITTRPTAELSKFYVRPEHHGARAASDLMVATIAVARARGVDAMWLGVNQENARANRFYAKHGFEVVGAKRFLVGDRWEHDFVRELVLRANVAVSGS